MTPAKLKNRINYALTYLKTYVFKEYIDICKETPDKDPAILSYFLHLRNVPEKGKCSKKNKNISVYIKGYYRFNKDSLTTYGTKLVYVRKYKTPPFKFGVHFDGVYDSAPELYHPFCHMQYDSSVLDDFFSANNLNDISNAYYESLRNIRVPTANMDLISTLIAIAADHVFMGTDNANGFRQLLENVKPMGIHAIGNLHKNGPGVDKFESSCWYSK